MSTGRRGYGQSRKLPAAFLALLLAALAASGAVLWPRHVAEEAAVRVAVVVDGAELFGLAEALARETDPGAAPHRRDAAFWEALRRLLVQLREAGVTGVGVYEWTLEDAAQRGEVFVLSRASLEAMGSPIAAHLPPGGAPGELVAGWTEGRDPWVVRRLNETLPYVATPAVQPASGVEPSEGLPLPAAGVWLLGRSSPGEIVLGFHPGEVRAVHDAGLAVFPRLRGGGLAAPGDLGRRLGGLFQGGAGAAARVGPVLFWGTTVTGYSGDLERVEEELAAAGAALGVIEFAPQLGLESLARLTGFRLVRVHSITEREMAAGIPPGTAVERWLRAVRERQVRLLYVRLYLPETGQGAAALVDHNLAYLRRLTGELMAAGYGLGMPEPVPAPPAQPWALGLIALAAGACAGGTAWAVWAWLRRELGLVPARPERERGVFLLQLDRGFFIAAAAGALVAVALFSALWLKGYTVLARQALALLAAVCFPTIAVLAGLDAALAVVRGKREPLRQLAGAAAGFGAALAFTWSGALFVAALLTDVRFLAKIAEFRGVKLAHVAPLAVLAVVVGLRVAGRSQPGLEPAAPGGGAEGSLPEGAAPRLGSGIVSAARYWLNRSIRLSELLVGLALAAALWVYVMRTGNDALPVPAFEAAFRRFLEQSFAVRPRTKEFLIGHPALLWAFVYWPVLADGSRRHRALAAALVLAGAIGQISVINSFAHAHTAVAVSAVRTGWGLLLGLALGAAAFGAVEGVKLLASRRAGRGKGTSLLPPGREGAPPERLGAVPGAVGSRGGKPGRAVGPSSRGG